MIIYRTQIEKVSRVFKGPRKVTFGWQQDRKAFSIWHSSTASFDTEYIVVATDEALPSPRGGKIRATIILDGFDAFHLVELE